MKRKVISGLMLTLLAISMLTLAFNIQQVKAEPGTIYIRADGSVDPPTAPIQRDGDIYTLTDNIFDEMIWVEKSNMIIDGNSFLLLGPADVSHGHNYGVHLSVVQNVTIKNMNIQMFFAGIFVNSSSQCTLENNSITNNSYGVVLGVSSGTNVVSNVVRNNDYAIWQTSSENNVIFHNDFIDNINQVKSYFSTSVWDDGYPSGGNYWSDYEERYPDAYELDGSGIWDYPYVIDDNNQDNYPLMNPWTPAPLPVVTATIHIDPDTLNLRSKSKWITAHIELPEGYEVVDINVSTILLNDEVPAESSKVSGKKLMVRFNRSEVIALLPQTGEAELTVTGTLFDGTPFEGSDTIRVR